LARANTGIVLETVSDYSFLLGSHAGDTNADTEGMGFWTAMTEAGSPWTAGQWFQDNDVFDTDFYDPDFTGAPIDSDTYNFDPSWAAISWAIGHGTCEDITATTCRTDSDCPVASYCPGFPLNNFELRHCIAELPRNFVTSSTASGHNNNVAYGGPAKSFVLGEDPQSGAFDGGGTNGGTNVAIITNSCGTRSRYWGDYSWRMFGGMHLLMMHAPVSAGIGPQGDFFADVYEWSGRGSSLANLILMNVNAPASEAWLDPNFVANTFASFNGTHAEGMNLVISWESTDVAAQQRALHETWAQTQQDNDPTGHISSFGVKACNYDCATFGF
jgi:hypothetical protein